MTVCTEAPLVHSDAPRLCSTTTLLTESSALPSVLLCCRPHAGSPTCCPCSSLHDHRDSSFTPVPSLPPSLPPCEQRTPKESLISQRIPLKFLEVDEERTRLVLSNRKAMVASQAQTLQVRRGWETNGGNHWDVGWAVGVTGRRMRVAVNPSSQLFLIRGRGQWVFSCC